MPASTDLLWNLAGWSVRSAILAAAAGLCLCAFRVRDVSVRLTVWTVVLCGALVIPLFSGLAPAVEVPVPQWQTSQPTPVRRAIRTLSLLQRTPLEHMPGPVAKQRPAHEVNWPSLLTGFWAAIAAAMLGQVALGILCGRRLIRNAVPIDLPSAARVYESESVRVPITLGSLKPVIVLPPGWRSWEQRKLAAVLAHESAHVQRRDPLRQLLASLYRAAFWFHPLAWWLQRELSELAESASDDAALASTRDVTFYAEVLLNFFASAPARVQWNAVAMAVSGKATKRMERILNTGRTLSRGLSGQAIAAIMIAALPTLYFIGSATPVWAVVNGQQPPPAPAVPRAPKPPTGIVGGIPGGVRGGVPGGVPGGVQGGVPGGVPTPPPDDLIAPEPPGPPDPPDADAFESDDGQRFAIVTDGDITGSMEPGDRARLKALRENMGSDFLWFERGGDEYVIKDPATIAQLKQAFDAIKEQGRLMGENGRAQAEAVRKMVEAIRENIQPHEAELGRLAEQLQRHASEMHAQIGNDENIKRLEAQLHDVERQFSNEHSDFAKVQRDLEKQLKSMQLDLNRSVERARELLKRLEQESLRSKQAEKII